jgi:hypothetical protein
MIPCAFPALLKKVDKSKTRINAQFILRLLSALSFGNRAVLLRGTGLIELKSPGAEIRGLPITEDEFLGVRVLFESRAGSDQPLKTGMDVYQLDVQQIVYPYDEPTGAQRIQVKTRVPMPIIIIVE